MSTKTLSKCQRGATLIELIMFMVIVSAGLMGILGVMNSVATQSADPLVHKQAIAAAESLLEEIELQDVIAAASSVAVTPANRSTAYHIVSDYHGFTTNGIYAFDNTPIVGLENYTVVVSVVPAALGAIPPASANLITVTVTNPLGGPPIVISGYRTAY